MPTTFVAIAAAVLAILPGAVFMIAYESRIGAFRLTVPDRIVRFLVASAALHAIFAGLSYRVYRDQIQSGALVAGKADPWAVELTALAYIVVPFLAGLAVGTLAKNPKIAQLLNGGNHHPRAWDYLFSLGVNGTLRMRLKSGRWIAGRYYTTPEGRVSYASEYGQEPEVYLAKQIRVDPDSGDFQFDENQDPIVLDSGILIKWAEVEYAQFIEEQ